MKILIVKPSSLGDVVHALPALRLLKKHFAPCEIHWWIEADLAPLLEGDPDIHTLHRFHRKRWASPWHWPEMMAAVRKLRAQCFDLVIDLQGLARSAAVAWLANGKFTVGVDDPREAAAGFYDCAVPRPSYGTHAADWYLAVAESLGVDIHQPYQWIPPRPEIASRLEQRWNPAPGRWIALQPGARWWNKRWPVEHFAALVAQLGQKHEHLHFAVLGGTADEPLGREIAAAMPEKVLNLCGQSSLPETIEWIRRCEVLVTNDTGPMHIAAALGKKIVALFGPTDPRRTGPYRGLSSVVQLPLPCVPCMTDHCHNPYQLQCLKELLPQNISERVAAALVQKGE